MLRNSFKVVLLGDGNVGKTSIMNRFIFDKFDDKRHATIQATFNSKRLNIGTLSITLDIWDTAGQERFDTLGPLYYRNSQGALLVYDITDMYSFERVKVWAKELRQQLEDDCCIAIIANKIDMEEKRVVPMETAISYAADVSATHYSTSAKFNRGIVEMFVDFSKRMYSMKNSNEANESSSSMFSHRQNDEIIQIIDDTNINDRKRCCNN
ncbi:hypothetical protein SNEBB_001176 [Seison nebaliae]|nr:hypothetical protein SNEBB_001176 [Seison nebaliae]